MSNKLKVAVVGAGYMAQEHVRAFSDINDVSVAGIFSRTRARAEALAAKFSIEHVCESINELYSVTRADLVVIAVPELQTKKVCLEAFEHPWVCLIEKPAGYDLFDANAIVEASHRAKARAYVALNRRHYGSTRDILAGLEDVPGRRMIHVQDQENPLVALEGGQPAEVVANWMYANSIHVIDYFKVFGRGEIVAVDPVVRWNPESPEFVVAKISFSSGDVGLYEAIWNGPGPWAVSVTTQQRRWECRPLERATMQEYKSRRAEPLTEHPWDSQFKPGVRLQAEEAVRVVRGQPAMLPSIEDALESMKLVSAIYA